MDIHAASRRPAVHLVLALVATMVFAASCGGGDAPAATRSKSSPTAAAQLTIDEAAAKFVADIRSQNTPGLVATFTSQGMSRAVALPDEIQGIKDASAFTVDVVGRTADSATVCLASALPSGPRTVATFWKSENGVWKIDNITMERAACPAQTATGS